MKGYKLTKRGQAVVLALQILLVSVFMFLFVRAAANAWDKEYEINSQISTQAAEMYYGAQPHK